MLESLPQRKPPPREVLIAGEPPSGGGYERLLERCGIAVAGRLAGRGPRLVDRVRGRDGFDLARRRSEVPIVVFGDGVDANPREMDFRGALERLVTRDGIKNRILHPAFLAHFARLQIGNHNTVVSFPGSGTQLAVFVLRELTRNDPDDGIDRGTDDWLLIRLAGNHTRAVYAIGRELEGFAPDADFSQYVPFNGFMSFRLQRKDRDDFVHMTCPATNFIAPAVFKTHEAIDVASLDFYRRFSDRIWLCVRNPLGVLLSYTTKCAGFIDADNGEAATLEELRDLRLAALLRNFEQFERTARVVRDYFHSALATGAVKHVVRYEDALTDPLCYVRSIARGVGVELSDDECRTLWEKFGLKPLGSRPSYWRPGGEKWRHTFAPENAEILRHLDYETLMRELGYEPNLDFTGRIDRDTKPKRFTLQAEVKHDLRYLGRSADDLPGLVRMKPGQPFETLQAYGNHRPYFDKVAAILADPVKAAVLASGLP